MLHTRLVNAVLKAGFTVVQDKDNFYRADSNGDNYITWFVQDDKAVCVGRRCKSLVDDAMTDLFYGSYTDKIKRAVEHLKDL